jgi:uncharacterized RDD family membrane protein YckC
MSAITVLNRDNSPLGPFTREQIAEKLQTGEISLDQLAFVDGLAQWTPLREVLAKVDGAAAAPPIPPPATIQPGALAASSYDVAAQSTGPVEYAGFWLRFAAYLIDSIIIGIPLSFVVGIFGFVFGIANSVAAHGANGNSPTDNPVAVGMLAGMELVIWAVVITISWLYFAKLESDPAQATFGKRILGLKVTDASGNRLSFGRASGRFFGKIVSGMACYIGFIMAGFTEKKQALHDYIANTLVIKG